MCVCGCDIVCVWECACECGYLECSLKSSVHIPVIIFAGSNYSDGRAATTCIYDLCSVISVLQKEMVLG